ncbi:alpha-L-rhamnosidase C-terminal domain-containing protein [Sphingomonas sp. M1A8_2b]
MLIALQPVRRVTMVAASFSTVLGLVRTRWRIAESVFALELGVPAGTTARIRLPTADPGSVREGKRPIAGNRDVTMLAQNADHVGLRVGSGVYRLTARAELQAIKRNEDAPPRRRNTPQPSRSALFPAGYRVVRNPISCRRYGAG